MQDLLKPSEVAALLKLQRKTVYKLANRGIIPAYRVGRSWRFNRREILELMSNESTTPSNGDLGKEEPEPWA